MEGFSLVWYSQEGWCGSLVFGEPVQQKGRLQWDHKPSEPSVSLGRKTQNTEQQKKAFFSIKVHPSHPPCLFPKRGLNFSAAHRFGAHSCRETVAVWTGRKQFSFNCRNHSEVLRALLLYSRCCALIGLRTSDPGFLAAGPIFGRGFK